MTYKPKLYLTSNVFTPEELGSNEKINQEIRKQIKFLWKRLKEISYLKTFKGRFPNETDIEEEVKDYNPDIIGCHLSHFISKDILKESNVFAISTSTAGYNHIQRPEKDNIIITHTPGVLHETVADYTIALILANLRDIVDLHNYVWDGKWDQKDTWDLDQNLSSIIKNKILGIVGMGEIGSELVKRLYPWNIKIYYYDIMRRNDIEKKYPNLKYKENLETLIQESDIISLHIPLNESTKNLINKNFLKFMKKDSLLINTARGGILNLDDLLNMLENNEIQINFSFDVFPNEPIDPKTLMRFKKIKELHPNIRMILMPHNASADADTRGKMDVLFLQDLIKIIESSNIEDLKNVNIIPEHRKILKEKDWKIQDYWKNKN
ncbi:MAG: NAD(P)-dependent oxidoreductase [Candidatus Hodarchaeota archaeon]